MLATSMTTALCGLDAHSVRVEVESIRGPSGLILVGLAETSVQESKVRVRAALSQLDINLGEYLMIINLAPARLTYEYFRSEGARRKRHRSGKLSRKQPMQIIIVELKFRIERGPTVQRIYSVHFQGRPG